MSTPSTTFLRTKPKALLPNLFNLASLPLAKNVQHSPSRIPNETTVTIGICNVRRDQRGSDSEGGIQFFSLNIVIYREIEHWIGE